MSKSKRRDAVERGDRQEDDQRRIRIGNQTAFSVSDLLVPFQYAVKNGFDAFEWFPDRKETGEGWIESDLTQHQCDSIRKTAERHDIALSVHVALCADPLNRLGAKLLDRQITFARRIGASIVNIHAYFRNGIDAYARAIASVRERLKATGIRICIENTPDDGPEAFNALFSWLNPRGESDGVGMCFDLGHANLYKHTRNDYLGYIDRLDSRVDIIHVHLHENYGDSDTHLPLFTGPAANDTTGLEGFIERLMKRRFSGAMIFEQWPQPPELLLDARERLVRLMKDRSVNRRRPPPIKSTQLRNQL